MTVFCPLEREGPVHQLNSLVQDTMKLLTLIGNAIVDIDLFIPLVEASHCSLRSYDWSLACSSISDDLEMSNEPHL